MDENMAVQVSEGAPSNPENAPAQDFDALLRQKDFQSEFDRRVSRALDTARSKWAQETERRIEKARADAEARARMTGEERMAHDFAQREAQLNQREQEILRRELHADMAQMIQQRGLPAQLAGVMNYVSAENLEESLDAVDAAFRSAVQSGVEERMRGTPPAAAARKRPEAASDADYYRENYVPGKR